jgi:hypothetical protein
MPLCDGALRDSLEQIQRQTPTREAFLVEALRVIANRTGAAASAALRDDPAADRLRLVHAFGLAAEALPAVCDPALWNVPRRAIHERQICVIDSAHQSPFVPKELVAVNPDGLSIAVIPFFEGSEPRGVIVLLAPHCNWFSDELMAELGGTMRVFATAFLDMPDDAAVEAAATAPAFDASALLRTVNELQSENARLTRLLAEAERARAAEAVDRVTAQSFLDAERQRVLTLEGQVESLQKAASEAKRAHEEEQRSWSAERMALAAERDRLEAKRPGVRDTADGISRLDAIIRSLAEKERVLKSLLTPSTDSRGGGSADEPIGVVHITMSELPRDTTQPTARAEPTRPAVVLVDSTEHGETLRKCLDGRGCVPCVIDDRTAAAVPTIACAANLVTAAAWRRTAELGSIWGRPRPGLMGYVLPPSADRGAWLGMLDVCLRPTSAAELLERLRTFVARPNRVILVSSDPEAMRTVLVQTNAVDVSTAVVSQATKVADLLPIVRPEAAILHISPASPCAFAAMAAIRGHDTYRDLPLLCLLDIDSDEVSFFDGGISELVDADPLPAGRVIEAVAAAVSAHRPH